ncbi:tyrosine--tRNA ligase [uncultured Mailhella sp.]|uniref:tyrosine--tRNA ligase n=1 Tax=uncultured Mailhella sp. TaxID=1981031 RepID=UPI00263278F5|nr:tyrosine--tRNA ligase [uncultured Mailhella sp.]
MTIDEQVKIIRRGIVDLVNEEDLRKKLAGNKPLNIKVGFDPTAPDLHLGHTVVIHKMRQFQELGHSVTFLIGDFTGRIGDPSGKSKTRPPLTEEQVKANAETYKEQVFKILDPAATTVAFNSTWGDQLKPADFLHLMSCCTVARMMERDDFAKRFKENAPIAIHEFMYPLLQAYDSVMLHTDVEMGGTDQIFNLLMGRNLQGHFGQEAQCVLTMPLLVGLDGEHKMSKSYGNYIGVMEAPADQFGKAMSISDELMWNWYELISARSLEEIADMKVRVLSGSLHPKLVKEELALEIVARYHGEAAAQAAREGFNNVFARGGIPEDAIAWSVNAGPESSPVAILSATGLTPSRGEAKRKIAAGSLRVNGEKLVDALTPLPAGEYTLKYGKKGFVVLTVKEEAAN